MQDTDERPGDNNAFLSSGEGLGIRGIAISPRWGFFSPLSVFFMSGGGAYQAGECGRRHGASSPAPLLALWPLRVSRFWDVYVSVSSLPALY